MKPLYTVVKPNVTRADWNRREVVAFEKDKLYIEVNSEDEAKLFAREIGASRLLRNWPMHTARALLMLYEVMMPCDRCSGRGIYFWGAVVNGVPTHSGPCFRCDSKGYQNIEDRKRNYGYDMSRKVF